MLHADMSAPACRPPSNKPQWRIQPVVPLVQKKERQRTFHHKVRSGCQTCKTRKLRCDETKPVCLRCQKAGYTCEGYAPPKAWIFDPKEAATKSDSSSTSVSASISTSTSPSSVEMALGVVRSPSSMGDQASIYEQRAFQFFRERTAPILATFAPSASHFWSNIVPRLSLSNQTIRSALIAVSSLHETKHYRQLYRAPPIADKVYAKHYTKAISALTQPDQPPPPEVILITCFIFIACENLKLVGTAPAELMHVHSGLKVLREWKANAAHKENAAADSMQDVVENSLEPMFARLEAQTFLLQESKAARAHFSKYDLNWGEPNVPNEFEDLFMARDAIHDIMQYLWFETQRANGPLFANTTAFKKIAGLMNRWQAAFKASFPLLHDRSWTAWNAAAALQVHYIALNLSLHGEALDSLLYWDLHHNKVQWLIDACAAIISEGPRPTKQPNSLWLYDFCLNPVLLLTASNCRHPKLRRKAIELLRVQHHWDEQGEPWDSCWTAKLCDMVVAIEEYGLNNVKTAEDVAESRRIRVMRNEMSVPGQVTICYMRSPFVKMEKFTTKWNHWTRPAMDNVIMWPFGEQVKHGNYQGLIRPIRTKCLCKSYGLPVPDAWAIPP